MMTLQSMAKRCCALRFCGVLSLLVLLIAAGSNLAGQNVSLPTANQSAFEAHFAAAQQAQRDRDYPTAEPEYQALELKPKDIDILYLLGSTYERLGKREVAHLEKVAPGSSRSEQLLAESYATSNEWPSAVIHFQNALAASPNRAGLRTELGEVLLHAGKVNQSIQEFDEELRRDPGNLRTLVRRGEAGLIQGNLDAALQDWEKAIVIDLEQ